MFGQAFQKGTWVFEELRIGAPFDSEKLRFSLTVWSNLRFLTGLQYEGEDLGIEESDGIGKGISCWIESDGDSDTS